MLSNNKGSYMALLAGMAIIIGGAFVYILLDSTMTGGGMSDAGFINAAEGPSNISTSDPTYANLKAMWVYGIPIALLIAGLIKVIISSQKKEGYL